MEYVSRDTFAHRLSRLMRERGWSQSDLARRLFGTYSDPKTGYIVALKRERINKWVLGKQYPGPDNLRLLADAFGLTVDELIGAGAASPEDRLTELARHVAALEGILQRLAEDLSGG